MRRIAIDMGGVALTARLLDERAPLTTQKVWDALPLSETFTHSIWSGLMIHGEDHPDWQLDVSRYPRIENPIVYVTAGDIIVWPQSGSVSLAYGPSQFRWLATQWIVTKVGEVEGDLREFAAAAYRMMFEGGRPVTVSRSSGAAAPVAQALLAGKKLVEVELGGKTWVVELFDDVAPEYSQALWDALPVEGQTSITHSSGEVLHCWTTIPGPKAPPKTGRAGLTVIPVEYRGKQIGGTYVAVDPRAMRGQHAGDLIWGAEWNDLRFIYGQGRFGGDGLKFGRIVRGDLEAFAEEARAVLRQGSRPMKLRKYQL